MLLIPIPLRTAWRRRVAAIVFFALLAAAYVWFATGAPGRRRPQSAEEWAITILVVAVAFAIFRWAVQFPRRLMRGDPIPSIRPRATQEDRDRAI